MPRAVKTLIFQRCEAMIPARCLDFVCHLQLELLPQKVFLQAKGGGGGGGLGGHGDGGDEEEEERHHHSDVVNWGYLSDSGRKHPANKSRRQRRYKAQNNANFDLPPYQF